MKWVGLMNNIRACAAEIVSTILYIPNSIPAEKELLS